MYITVVAWRHTCRLPILGTTAGLAGCARAQMVARHFERLFPGRVSHVRMAVDTRDVDSLIREYWKLRQKAIDLLDEYESARKRGRPVKRRRVRCPPLPGSVPA